MPDIDDEELDDGDPGALLLQCQYEECGAWFERTSLKGRPPRFCSRTCNSRWRNPDVKYRRATADEMADRYDEIINICRTNQPLTVRQAYYRAVVIHLVDKTEQGYAKVQQAILHLRRDGRLPYNWIIDNTRWMRKPDSYSGVADALRTLARRHRRDLWSHAEVYLEVWAESDSIAGVAYNVTGPLDVPLMVTRGFSSETFAYNAADKFKSVGRLKDVKTGASKSAKAKVKELAKQARAGKKIIIIYIGDLDPAGLAIERSLKASIEQFAPGLDLEWSRLFVTQEQRDRTMRAALQDLGTPAKAIKRYGWIGGQSIEAEAIDPPLFRRMLSAEIEQYMDPHLTLLLRFIQKEEREHIDELADEFEDFFDRANGEVDFFRHLVLLEDYVVDRDGTWQAIVDGNECLDLADLIGDDEDDEDDYDDD